MKRLVSIFLRFVFGIISIVANGAVSGTLWKNSYLRSQPNLLLGNLAAADFLMGVGYFYSAVATVASGMSPSHNQCIFMLFPILWASYTSVCSVVPIAHYRVKLIKAYSRSAGSTDFAESSIFNLSLTLLWVTTAAGALLCFVHKRHDTDITVCVLPMAFSDRYLIAYFLFTTTITTMVATEYFRLIVFVICGSRLLSFSQQNEDKWHKYVKFDPRVSRIVVMMAGTFVVCWLPNHLTILFYLYPYGKQPHEFSVSDHATVDLVAILPLLHSTINPFIYSLSEKEFRETIAEMVRFRRRSGWPLRPPMQAPPPSSPPSWRPPPQRLMGSRRKWRVQAQSNNCYTVSQNIPMHALTNQQRATPQLTKVRKRRSYYDNKTFIDDCSV